MGGPTGQTKDAILHAMLQAEERGTRARVNDLAHQIGIVKSTVSGHLRNLSDIGQVTETRQRGEWALTQAGRDYVRSLTPQSQGIAFRGIIAAGPAVPIMEGIEEYLDDTEYGSPEFFALRVKGTSMVGFGIEDDDIVIMRRVDNVLEVREGDIVAALVPEGTGVDEEDWLDRLPAPAADPDSHPPALDHVTLKRFDARFSAYMRRGVAHERVMVRLQGSQGTLRPTAVAIAGVLVERRRKYSR